MTSEATLREALDLSARSFHRVQHKHYKFEKCPKQQCVDARAALAAPSATQGVAFDGRKFATPVDKRAQELIDANPGSELSAAYREVALELTAAQAAQGAGTVSEAAWLIERGGLCLGFCEHKWKWVAFTDESAFRFARRSDAVRFLETVCEQPNLLFAAQFTENVLITEHSWTSRQPSSAPAKETADGRRSLAEKAKDEMTEFERTYPFGAIPCSTHTEIAKPIPSLTGAIPGIATPAVQPEAQVMERVRKLPGVTDDGTWVQCSTSEVAALVTRECDAALEQQVRTDCGRLNCWTDGTGAGVEEVLHNPSLDENVKQLARAHRHATDAARLAALEEAAQAVQRWSDGWKARIAQGVYQGQTLQCADVRRDEGQDLAKHIRALAAGKEQPHD